MLSMTLAPHLLLIMIALLELDVKSEKVKNVKKPLFCKGF